MKCYATLPIDNMYVISQGIYQYLQTNSDVLTTTQYGWHFVDCKKLFIVDR
jgi:hypothetical protein